MPSLQQFLEACGRSQEEKYVERKLQSPARLLILAYTAGPIAEGERTKHKSMPEEMEAFYDIIAEPGTDEQQVSVINAWANTPIEYEGVDS